MLNAWRSRASCGQGHEIVARQSLATGSGKNGRTGLAAVTTNWGGLRREGPMGDLAPGRSSRGVCQKVGVLPASMYECF